MIAVPVSLHLNSVGDISVRVMLSALLITIINCSNACTIQIYFSLVGKNTKLSLGSEICSARAEKIRSRYLVKACLTVLFYLSFVKTSTKDKHDGAPKGWEPHTTYSDRVENPPFTLARLSEDFSGMDSVDSMELKRLA